MNTEVLYNINNFDLFDNILTIYKKHIIVHKRVHDEDENENIINSRDEIMIDKIKYIPIYGHYYNANNHFIAKPIIKRKISKDLNNFVIVKNEDLVRPYNGGIYVFKNMDDLYKTLEKLKTFNNNEILIGK